MKTKTIHRIAKGFITKERSECPARAWPHADLEPGWVRAGCAPVRLAVALLLAIGLALAPKCPAAHTNNAVYLSHNYVKYSSYLTLTDYLCAQMKLYAACPYWFVNVGVVDSTGHIVNPATELADI